MPRISRSQNEGEPKREGLPRGSLFATSLVYSDRRTTLKLFKSNSYHFTKGGSVLTSSNSTQCDSINPLLQNTDVTTILAKGTTGGSLLSELEQDFNAVIYSEEQQHAKELLGFIDAEIKQLSGTGL